jgi:hypothetical protein
MFSPHDPAALFFNPFFIEVLLFVRELARLGY